MTLQLVLFQIPPNQLSFVYYLDDTINNAETITLMIDSLTQEGNYRRNSELTPTLQQPIIHNQKMHGTAKKNGEILRSVKSIFSQ